MEYLMTYGWAILVIMVAGAAMWHLDIFNMGKSVPPTASGFQIMKPFLATCKIGPKAMYGTDDAFFCQLKNNAGMDIRVTDVMVKINGNNCWSPRVANKPEGGGFISRSILYRTCTANGNCPSINCNSVNDNACLGGTGPLLIKKDAQITVYNYYIPYNNICQATVIGEKYKVDIDLTYEVSIGGVTSTKHEIGTINLYAT